MEPLYDAFNRNVWLLILLSILGVTITIKFLVHQSTLSESTFVRLVLLFIDGIDLENKFKRIKLLYFWLFASFNLSIYYSAIITSTVISPPKESSFSFLSEVSKKNFTILFDSKIAFQLVNTSVRNHIHDQRSNKDIAFLNQALEHSNTKVRILGKEVHSGEREGARLLASERNFFLVHMWQFVITYFNEVNNLFGNISPHKRPVHCYLGKRHTFWCDVYGFCVAW